MRKQIFWLLNFCFLGAFGFSWAESSNVYILSYPRSGNQWLNLCLDAILSAPDTSGRVEVAPNLKLLNNYYSVTNLDQVDKSRNFLVVIVRNYRECMMRQCRNNEMKVAAQLDIEYNSFCKQIFSSEGQLSPINYSRILKWYDEWNPDKRFLIYYEDLMNRPEEILTGLIAFLGKDTYKVSRFMAEYEGLKAYSLKAYLNPQSIHFGVDFHASLMSAEKIAFCDNFMKTKYPDYWEKYLSRYQ